MLERLNAEREVVYSSPERVPILKVLEELRNEGTSFALQAARPLRGLDDYMGVPSSEEDLNVLSSISAKYIYTHIKYHSS